MIAHWIGVTAAIIAGSCILIGILIGGRQMPSIFGNNHTIRQVCIALWALVLPSWFAVDNYWAPGQSDAQGLQDFHHNQEAARDFWALLGGIAIVIVGGSTAEPTRP